MAESKETLLNKSEISPKGTSEGALNSKVERREIDHGMIDLRERHNVPKEIKSWMERIEEDPTQMPQVTDDSGQPLLIPANVQNPKVTLPITRTKFIEGFKKSFDEAGRWLSSFLLRLIKMKQGNVKFKEE